MVIVRPADGGSGTAVAVRVLSVSSRSPVPRTPRTRPATPSAAEKAIDEKPREERGKATLTELFESLKTDGTPVIVENIIGTLAWGIGGDISCKPRRYNKESVGRVAAVLWR